MSKPILPQAESPAQAIPLSDVTITCYRAPHFCGEEKEVPITIPGRQVGQILAWLAQTRPGLVGGAPEKDLWPPSDVAMDLEGLGEILRGLSNGDLENVPCEIPSIFSLLADVAGDLAARLSASEDGDERLRRATITLPTRKAVAS